MTMEFDTTPDAKATSDVGDDVAHRRSTASESDDLRHQPTDECLRCGDDEPVDADRCKVALEDLAESHGALASGNLCDICWQKVFNVVHGESID